MDYKEYQAAALTTASDKWYGEKVPFNVMATALLNCATQLQKLDEIKKALFYGRDFVTNIGEPVETLRDLPLQIANHGYFTEKQAEMVIHGIIGRATEAGELLELLASVVIGKDKLDVANLIEETGDGNWYDQLIYAAIGITANFSNAVNIEKLRKRFPEKFKEFDALNRDLKKEREILDAAAKDAPGS